MLTSTIELEEPKNNDAAAALGRMDYDPYSILFQSSSPFQVFKAVFHTSEGFRIVCINQEN